VIAARGVNLRHMSTNTNRFLAVNLTESEWQALRAVTPDPVAWIKSQIQQLLEDSGVTPIHEEPDSHFAASLAD
jgi:hypothetical protein